MRIPFSLLLLLFFGTCQSFSQDSNLDRLFSEIQKLPDDSVKLVELIEIGKAFKKTDSEKGLEIYKDALSVAEKLNIQELQVKIEYEIARLYIVLAQYDTAILHAKKTEEIYKSLKAEKELSRVYNIFLYSYKRMGDFEKANEFAFKYLEVNERLKDSKGTATALGKIGSLFYAMNKPEEGLEYAHRAYELAKTQNYPNQCAYAAQLIADLHIKLGQDEEAIEFVEEAMLIYDSLDKKQEIIAALISHGNLNLGLKNYKDALDDFEKALDLSQKINATYFVRNLKHNIANAHYFLGNYPEALKNYHQGIHLNNKEGVRLHGDAIYERLAETYAAVGLFDSAYYYQKVNKVLSDSLLNVENSKNIAELQTQYETAKKEATIATQEGQLNQRKTQLFAVLSLLILALGAGIWLWQLSKKLRKRNEEKEFLIKEIHHRVKNNLQVLSSLLYLQSRHIKDESALDAVREGQNRVDAMSLIHQKLYMGDNLSAVEMPEYLNNLSDTLLDSFGADDQVEIENKVENLRLDVDTAIPLGLIINELVTNSLKYAFPNNQNGKIEIALWKNDSNKLCLKVSDNGVGKNDTPELENSTSFGSNLIEILSKKLKGTPQILEGKGYATLIEFENFKQTK